MLYLLCEEQYAVSGLLPSCCFCCCGSWGFQVLPSSFGFCFMPLFWGAGQGWVVGRGTVHVAGGDLGCPHGKRKASLSRVHTARRELVALTDHVAGRAGLSMVVKGTRGDAAHRTCKPWGFAGHAAWESSIIGKLDSPSGAGSNPEVK